MEKKFEFKPFEKVLVRDCADQRWNIEFFGYYVESDFYYSPYKCSQGSGWKQCIPYEGNEHLLGTTYDYEEPYEPKDGDFVTITKDDRKWATIFHLDDGDYFCYAGLALPDGIMFLNEHILKDKDDIVAPSTDDEKKELLNTLHERLHKDWDAEKKEFVDCKWTPQEGERVWRIEFNSAYTEFNLIERIYDSSMALSYKNGLIFKLYDEMATKKASQMTEAINNVK